MAGDIEDGIETRTQRWQCSGCDRICAALTPAGMVVPACLCLSDTGPAGRHGNHPDWRRIDKDVVSA